MIIMKKLTSLLIGCSLALAGAALAQQPVEQQSPSKGKRAPEADFPPSSSGFEDPPLSSRKPISTMLRENRWMNLHLASISTPKFEET